MIYRLCVQRQVAEQNLQFMRHSRKSVITKMKNIKFSMTKADEYKSLQEAYVCYTYISTHY